MAKSADEDGVSTEQSSDVEEEEVDPEHIQSILDQIQRLHNITARDGDIEDKQELRKGHQQDQPHHHPDRRQRQRTRRENTPAIRQDVNNNPNPNSLISNCSLNRVSFLFGFSIILFICVGTPLVNKFFEYVLGVRCFVPNNYLVWEATRPKSDCNFCRGLDGPIILPNMSREQFSVSRDYFVARRDAN